MTINNFEEEWDELQADVHENAQKKGWWKNPPEIGTSIALIHSELSEALEGVGCGIGKDKHCPTHTNLEVELADTVIRIMDLAVYYNLDVSGAITEKILYNKSVHLNMAGKSSKGGD